VGGTGALVNIVSAGISSGSLTGYGVLGDVTKGSSRVMTSTVRSIGMISSASMAI
jgi:hypothetical protein